MHKKITALSISILAAAAIYSSTASAEVGFEFRVPFQTNNKSSMSNYAATSSLLKFDLDEGTYVGLLNEGGGYTDNGSTTTTTKAVSTTLQALRIAKKTMDFADKTSLFVGLDLGNVSSNGIAFSNAPVADIFGEIKLLSSKGKVTSYMSAELLYRVANVSPLSATSTVYPLTDIGGVQAVIGAGIGF